MFAFGHGLSYTRVEWSDLRVRQAEDSDGTGFAAAWIAEVTVRNAGSRAGSDVVQLYLSTEDTEELWPRPRRWLAAFQKVVLAPGQQQTLRISIPGRAFSSYDASLAQWIVRPGRYVLRAARSASDVVLDCAVIHRCA
jgi:beta-glucosidase